MITDEMRNNKSIIKYKIDNFDVIFDNGDIETINSSMVEYLYIENDFDELYFPIINVSLLMNDEIYERINEESDTVQFRIRLIKNIYDNNDKLIEYEQVFNKLFRCFIDKQKIIKDNESHEDKKKIEASNNMNFNANSRNFYLFTEDVINCKKNINLSVTDSDLTDLIIYLFNQCKVSKLLMTKLDNREHITNLTVPNKNIIEAIKYINDLKGLYKKGMLLYFDIDCAYMIDKNSKCTAWRRNEVQVTHIHVSNQKNADSQMNGQMINADRKVTHLFAHTNRLEMHNNNIINDQISGNSIHVINAKNDTNVEINANSTQIGSANKKYVYIKEGNEYKYMTIQTRMEENENICNISFVGIDMDVFTPNKELILSYEDTKLNKQYGGNYRICKVTSVLSKNADELVGEIQVVMKKQNK